MKHFSPSNPILSFSIRCPKDAVLKNALVKARVSPAGEAVPVSAECHGSCGDAVCARCCSCILSIFFHGQEPDDLCQAAVDPRTSPVWQG